MGPPIKHVDGFVDILTPLRPQPLLDKHRAHRAVTVQMVTPNEHLNSCAQNSILQELPKLSKLFYSVTPELKSLEIYKITTTYLNIWS